MEYGLVLKLQMKVSLIFKLICCNWIFCIDGRAVSCPSARPMLVQRTPGNDGSRVGALCPDSGVSEVQASRPRRSDWEKDTESGPSHPRTRWAWSRARLTRQKSTGGVGDWVTLSREWLPRIMWQILDFTGVMVRITHNFKQGCTWPNSCS